MVKKDNIKEINTELIQQYLPDDHIDKIKPMESKSLVGRYVKSIYDWNMCKIKRGEYLKILEDKDNCFIYEKYGVATKPISNYFELMPEGFIPNNVSKEESNTSTTQFDLSNTKIKVDTPELSRLVQEKAFELGWEWGTGGKIIQITGSPYLYFYDDKKIAHGSVLHFFNSNPFKEIFPSDLGIINYGTPGNHSETFQITLKEEYFQYPLTSQEAIKKKGFDEKEFYSNPFNQVLELPKKSKQNNKKQLILT